MMEFIPEFCVKIDENLVHKGKKRVYTKSYRHTFYPNGISDDDLFFSSIFTRGASRRLTSASLLKARNPASSGMASPLSALYMKASDSCKIQVLRYSLTLFRVLLIFSLCNRCWSVYRFNRISPKTAFCQARMFSRKRL